MEGDVNEPIPMMAIGSEDVLGPSRTWPLSPFKTPFTVPSAKPLVECPLTPSGVLPGVEALESAGPKVAMGVISTNIHRVWSSPKSSKVFTTQDDGSSNALYSLHRSI